MASVKNVIRESYTRNQVKKKLIVISKCIPYFLFGIFAGICTLATGYLLLIFVFRDSLLIGI
jgi:hypothetical protein